MRAVPIIAAAAMAAFAAQTQAQDATAQPAVAPPPVFKQYQKVEVADDENPGVWKACTIETVFKGAYVVSCNYDLSMVRDIKVRAVGGQPAGQTAAQPVTGPPFKRDDIVLASPMGLIDDWRLCVVLGNYVQSQNTYEVRCGGRSTYRVLPRWVRVDDEAPQ